MEATELLLQLEILEEGLYDYSFDQLTTAEAMDLRQKFEVFKTDLSRKIFNEPYEADEDFLSHFGTDRTDRPEKMHRPISQMNETIMRLKKTETTATQHGLIESLELAAMVLTELTMNKNNR